MSLHKIDFFCHAATSSSPIEADYKHWKYRRNSDTFRHDILFMNAQHFCAIVGKGEIPLDHVRMDVVEYVCLSVFLSELF